MRKRICFIIIFAFFMFSTSALAQGTRVTKEGFIASASETLLDKAMEYASVGDEAAFQQLLDSNMVFELRSGLTVYIVDTKLFQGKILIRPVGQTAEIWTLIGAVEK